MLFSTFTLNEPREREKKNGEYIYVCEYMNVLYVNERKEHAAPQVSITT